MNSPARPHRAAQDHHLNRNNNYSDTSYSSSDLCSAPIPVNRPLPFPLNGQQQSGQNEHENIPVTGSGLDHYSNRRGIEMRGKPDVERIRSGSWAIVQNFMANFFDIEASDVQRITSYIFFIFSFVNFIFLIISCSRSQVDGLYNSCMTFWGYKSNCDTTSYTIDVDLLKCKNERRWMKFGAAFSILAIIFSAALWFMSWILCCWVHSQKLKSMRSAHKEGHGERVPLVNLGKTRWYIIGILITIILFEFIAWVTITSIREGGLCVEVLGGKQTSGVGFDLGLIAWTLEMLLLLSIVLLI
ncbi:unnamed protein product [Phytomonas sp. Hart1]|nr:unnamed protein product [Phytomonas sp. Hart1]|eukprot:CCW68680.1 unnamed protein product [Phytomonas sp. isolate Hart1]